MLNQDDDDQDCHSGVRLTGQSDRREGLSYRKEARAQTRSMEGRVCIEGCKGRG